MSGECVCGGVSVTIDAKPEFINDCDCSLCRKVGGAWGYFSSSSVATQGTTRPVVRRDRENPSVEIHSCATCATTTHFVPTESFMEKHPAADQVGVNMRLFDPGALEGVEVRFPNGKGWSGEGPYTNRRAALTIGGDTRW